MTEQIILRYHLNQLPKFEDRLGHDEFMAELKKYGWVNKEGKLMRDFTLVYLGKSQANDYYVEWRAIAKDKLPEGFLEELEKKLDEFDELFRL